MRNFRLNLVVLVLLALHACKSDNKSKTVADAPVEIKFPSFNKDSAFQYVKQQVMFGPRIPNTPAHQKCADWFVEKFKSFGTEVIDQNFRSRHLMVRY